MTNLPKLQESIEAKLKEKRKITVGNRTLPGWGYFIESDVREILQEALEEKWWEDEKIKQLKESIEECQAILKRHDIDFLSEIEALKESAGGEEKSYHCGLCEAMWHGERICPSCGEEREVGELTKPEPLESGEEKKEELLSECHRKRVDLGAKGEAICSECKQDCMIFEIKRLAPKEKPVPEEWREELETAIGFLTTDILIRKAEPEQRFVDNIISLFAEQESRHQKEIERLEKENNCLTEICERHGISLYSKN